MITPPSGRGKVHDHDCLRWENGGGRFVVRGGMPPPGAKTGSKPYGLSRDDLLKILKGGLVAVAGAALLAAASWLEALPGQIDFGPYEALAVVACQVGVNTIRKYISDTQERILR